MTARRWLLPALAGIASVALGLGAAELAAAIVAPTASPSSSSVLRLIDFAPSWAKDAAIALFGTGGQGRAARRHRPGAAGGRRGRRACCSAVARRLGRIAHRGRRDRRDRRRRDPLGRRGVSTPFPSIVAAIVAVIALGCLLRGCRLRIHPVRRHPAIPPSDPGRRAFLGLGRRRHRARRARRGRGHPALRPAPVPSPPCATPSCCRRPAVTAPPVPAGAELGIDGPGDRHHPERASSTASTPRCRSRASIRPPGRCGSPARSRTRSS